MKQILVCVGNGIGNVIQATPAITALTRLVACVDIYVQPPVACEILQGITRRGMISGDASQFRQRQYDQIYKIGYGDLPRTRNAHTRVAVVPRAIESQLHESLTAVKFVRRHGFTGKTPPTYCAIGTPPHVFTLPTIGFHAGSSNQAKWLRKRYPPANFAKVCQIIHDELPGVSLVLFGTGTDDSIPSPHIRDLRDCGGLAEQAAMISQCRAFCTNDSGLSHVAAARCVPTCVLFGPTVVWKNLPPQFAMALRQPIGKLPCQPCQYRDPGACSLACLTTLPPATVAATVLHLFDATRFPDPIRDRQHQPYILAGLESRKFRAADVAT